LRAHLPPELAGSTERNAIRGRPAVRKMMATPSSSGKLSDSQAAPPDGDEVDDGDGEVSEDRACWNSSGSLAMEITR
jgi:hypothetical protein